jgi:hypothetical protein
MYMYMVLFFDFICFDSFIIFIEKLINIIIINKNIYDFIIVITWICKI